LGLHAGLRWLIIVVSVAALVWFGLVWLAGQRNEKADRGLMAAFSGLIDLQVLVGLIYFIWSGITQEGFPVFRIEHAVTMIIAAVVAHLAAMWRKADVKIRARNNVALIIGVLVIVFIGLSFLPVE
jgi:cytochrome bd-type quinol oxidase subunit 2